MFLKVLARKAKNKYSWKGFAAVPKALQELKVDNPKKSFYVPYI